MFIKGFVYEYRNISSQTNRGAHITSTQSVLLTQLKWSNIQFVSVTQKKTWNKCYQTTQNSYERIRYVVYIVEPLEATTNLFAISQFWEQMDLGLYHAWLHQDLVPYSMDHKIVHMDVSKNSGFFPQIIHFNRVFHYKSSILGGFSPYFWKHPYI